MPKQYTLESLRRNVTSRQFERMQQRIQKGIIEYGDALHKDTPIDPIIYALEELDDAVLYLQHAVQNGGGKDLIQIRDELIALTNKISQP